MSENGESRGLATVRTAALTAAELRDGVNLIQEVMKAVMQKGQHYGVTPGCGDKPTLLKPGAEKLAMTFRLAADPQVQELSADGEIGYRTTVRLIHIPTGNFVGAGIGEASTAEDKYAWRSAVNAEEFAETPENRRREKWRKGRQGEADYKLKQVRTNPADLANTILKMSKKRALVDAVLTATAASDIFTQDIEEMAQEPEAPHSQPQPEAADTSIIGASDYREVVAKFKKAEAQGLKKEAFVQFLSVAVGVNTPKNIPASKLAAVNAFLDAELQKEAVA